MVEVQKYNDRYTVAQVAEAIRAAQGIKAAAARMLGCEWRTVDSYIKRYRTCALAYEQATERVLDVAESNVIRAIMDGSLEESKWYLVRKGQRRGYGDMIRHSGDLTLKLGVDELARIMYKNGNGNGNNGSKASLPGDSEPRALPEGRSGS